jgi:hypothetical protein
MSTVGKAMTTLAAISVSGFGLGYWVHWLIG